MVRISGTMKLGEKTTSHEILIRKLQDHLFCMISRDILSGRNFTRSNLRISRGRKPEEN
jgi:hypothetical protein